MQEPKRGQGTSAVFIARNRFAVLDKGSNQIVIKNLNNEITKKAPSPCATTDAIFYAGTGTLLCRSEDKVLCTLSGPPVYKYSMSVTELRYTCSQQLAQMHMLPRFAILH